MRNGNRPTKTNLFLALFFLAIMTTPSSAAPAASSPRPGRLIFMHGLGDSGDGWRFLQNLVRKELPHISVILPDAPFMPVSVAGGARVAAWFDVRALPIKEGQEEDEVNMRKSMQRIQGLIDEAIAEGISPDRIVVGGFSQGAILTSLLVPRSNLALAGGLMIAGRVPLLHKTKDEVTEIGRKIPILAFHGDADNKIAFSVASSSISHLRDAGCDIDFRVFPGLGHSVNDELLTQVIDWLREKIPA